jgi:predicted PurR-regulated permease PerM
MADSQLEGLLDAQTTALRSIAGLLCIGAAWLLAPILVPFVLGMILAITLSPLARRIERAGLGRTGSSLACLVLITLALICTAALLAYQAGTILQQSGRHIHRLSVLLADTTTALGGDHVLRSLGAMRPGSAGQSGEAGSVPKAQSSAPQNGNANQEPVASGDYVAFWEEFLRGNLRLLGGWLVQGIGGFIGLVGSGVICLSFVFYLLQTRSEWVNRLTRVLLFLGLHPRRASLERVQSGIVTFAGFVVLVSVSGAVVIGTAAWLIGLPQPFLWGIVFGLLEFVPYFGPMVGGTLLSLVALTTGEGGWWQLLSMLGVIFAWLTLEGYVIAPMVYGRAIRFDPVMVLVAILFFGWLWGPLGMVTALPVMVFLRELVVIAPETPALDALLEPGKPRPVSQA